MKVTKNNDNSVVLDYGRGVGVKYQFNKNNSLGYVTRKQPRIMVVAEEYAEEALVRNSLKIPAESIDINKVGDNLIEIQEVTADDVSVLTKFNFASKQVTKISQDNYVGEEKMNPTLSFADYSQNLVNKAKLEIAKQAMKLLR